jgi:hypothetical protein
MDYRIKKENNIVYCILNNIDQQSGTYSQEVARNVSDFILSLMLKRNNDIIIDDNSDDLLLRAASDNFYSHAVVMITGTHTGLSERLFDLIENKCKDHFTISGHILDRGDAYYEIHNQFYIVNLQEYKRLGKPKMGDVVWNEEHQKLEPIRSEECVRGDNEIPVWVKKGTSIKTYKHKRHGWNFIDVGLKNDAIFCDVGDDIRNNKNYLYYEYDHVFFRHVPNLFNYSLICNNMVTPWNSDSIPNNLSISEPSVDHYISTGTGLNWMCNLLKMGYHPKTKVTFIDLSSNVLSFMKVLIDEWDGKDYASFYMKQLKFIPFGYNLDLTNHEKNIRHWFDNFKTNFNDFEEVWNKLKQLKFEFILFDFFAIDNWSFIKKDEVTFVNVSDAFNHAPYAHYSPVKFRVARENALINNIKKINENVWLYIPTRLGHFYQKELNIDERIMFGRVNEFNLWDINEFMCPPWHEKNWKSYCPITGNVRIV